MAAPIPCLPEVGAGTIALGPVGPPDLPFGVERIFYIYGVPAGATRGGHAHLKTRLALFCLSGGCSMEVRDANREATFELRARKGGVLVEPGEWHSLRDFTADTILLVLASHRFDPADYVQRSGPRETVA